MITRLPRLPDDIVLMIGTVERSDHLGARHRVYAFNRTQLELDRLCGVRGQWAIVFGEYDEEWLDTMVKPFLVAGTADEIRVKQETGQPLPYYPTLWHVPSHTSLMKPIL